MTWNKINGEKNWNLKEIVPNYDQIIFSLDNP